MYLLDVSIRDLKYFCVLFVLFVFLFMLLALLRCYTSIFDGFIFIVFREGVRKKTREKCGILPNPPWTRKKLPHNIFLENEPLMRETNFTLGPTQKSVKIYPRRL